MNKLILLQGISGSGKTTYAKRWVEEDPLHRVRLNYDDIRCMLGKYWVPEREPLMLGIFKSALLQSMDRGYDIIVDNMSNLNPKHQEEYFNTVEDWNNHTTKYLYKIEFKLINTPVEICIERDSKRQIPIGEKVIRQQWRKYRDYIIQQSVKEMLDHQVKENSKLPHCIIVDMDATLCFNTSGRPFYGPGTAEKIINDIPNINVVDLVKAYCEQYGCDLIVITGRDDSCREPTLEWLGKYGLYPKLLLMRSTRDYSKGDECKKKLYEEHIKDKYNVDLVFEDSSKVVKMYRDLGLTVLQPNEGKF
jgi:predicted kinase